ncbi:MAG TPA: hypothetical protein DIC56_19410 [Rhizobium sp.]|nr:hypothetical protein [Rhizobium sp.]
MADQPGVTINFDALLESLRKTVRRSVIMMGVGVNAAEYQPRISHVLADEGPFGVGLVPDEVSEEDRAHFADEFSKWVKANGLRELLEGFSIYLNELYSALFLIDLKVSGHRRPELVVPPKFERRGLADQLSELGKLISIDQRSRVILASLNQARNCYAHRRGRVGLPDLNDGRMVVTWNRPYFSVTEPDGQVHYDDQMFGRTLPEGGVLSFGVREETREFTLGQELVLAKPELKQICLHVLLMGEIFYNVAVQTAVDAGLLPPRPEQSE